MDYDSHKRLEMGYVLACFSFSVRYGGPESKNAIGT